MKSNPTLKRWYTKYNRKYFGNKLPKDTIVFWCKRVFRYDDAIGAADVFDALPHTIYIACELKKIHKVALIVLLHEMCHIAVGGDPDHGRRWQLKMKSLASRGAFESLW